MKTLKLTLIVLLILIVVTMFANLHLLTEIGGLSGALTVFAGFGLIVYGGYKMNTQKN